MVKKILIAFLLFSGAMLYGQNDQINFQKYWKTRNTFRENFVKIGKGPGESLPIGSINPDYCVDDIDFNGSAPSSNYAQMLWGDGMIRQGHYLQFLATEYALLKKYNQDTWATLNELYYALQAINRCDLAAEFNESQFYLSTPLDPNLNGFYIREDIPEDFNLFWQNKGYKPRCISSGSYGNVNLSKSDKHGPTEGEYT